MAIPSRHSLILGIAALAVAALRPTHAQGVRESGESSAMVRDLLATPPAARGAATKAFWRQLRLHGAPLIDTTAASADSADVTFVYSGDPVTTRAVSLLGGPGTLDTSANRLTDVPETNIWLVTFRIPKHARFLYRFGVEETAGAASSSAPSMRMVADSFNTKQAPYSPGAVASVFEGPNAALLTASVVRDGIPKGSLTTSTFVSKTLKQTRNLWTYLPAGYTPAQTAHLPLLVVFDGSPYTHRDYVPTQTILDNLIAERRIRPVVAVFVDTPQPSRREDLWLSDSFADFIAKELVPWARRTYSLSIDARETVIAGSSLGGLTATFVAMRHPDVAADVISQSGSYWTGKREGTDQTPEWIDRAFSKQPRLPIDFWMEVGTYESARDNAIGMAPTNRRFHETLIAKGYRVRYQEFAGGHEYINWRASLPAALEYFLSPAR